MRPRQCDPNDDDAVSVTVEEQNCDPDDDDDVVSVSGQNCEHNDDDVVSVSGQNCGTHGVSFALLGSEQNCGGHGETTPPPSVSNLACKTVTKCSMRAACYSGLRPNMTGT